MTSEAASDSRAPAGADGGFTHRQILTILSGLMLGMFLAALDMTVVSVAIRTIADELHGFELQVWATTAFLITSTISTPLYGKLSDIYGRRPFYLIAIAIFVGGSMLCGMASSMYELAAFRAIQGVGAGGLMSLALAIIGDIVPPRERSRYQGIFMGVFGTSSVLGPLVGGFFAGTTELFGISGWRWIFYVNVPIGILAFVVVAKVLHLPHKRLPHRIDWPGAVALLVALGPLLTVAEQGREWGWSSGWAVACYVIGAAGLLAFLLIERWYKDEAILPLRLFKNRSFSISSASSLIVGIGMFGALIVLPLYLQVVKGSSPTEAGLQTTPLVLGILAGSMTSGVVISRTGRYKQWPVLGSALMVVGLLMFHYVGADTPLWQVMLIMPIFGIGLGLNMQPVVVAVQNAVNPREIGVDTPLWHTMGYAALLGLGLGFNMQPLVLAVQNAVPPQDMGVATSSATFFRQMGGTLGTAVFLSILFSTVTDKIVGAFQAAAQTPAFQAALQDPAVTGNPANGKVVEALQSGGGGGTPTLPAGTLDDTSFLSDLDDRLARPFLVGFSESMDLVFQVAALVLVVAFVVVLFLPEEKLRTMSGIQAQAQQRADEAAAAELAAGRSGAVFEPGATSAAATQVSAPSSQMVDGEVLEDETASSGAGRSAP